MKILLVEDDGLFADALELALSREFPGVELSILSTESAFRSALPDLASAPPNVVVLDILLRWSDPSPNMEPPPHDVQTEGYYRAGVRCQELLASNPRTAGIPIIFYSVAGRDEIKGFQLTGNALFLQKGSDPSDLVRKIRSILAAQQKVPSTTSGGRDRIFISYSHKDKKFLDELLIHLRPSQRSGRVVAWSDKQIQPGAKWFDEIRRALAVTRVAVMLVTADFLASDFIHEHELGPLLKAAEAGGARILWVPVRACSYRESALKHYQAVISPNKPLAEMKAERDQAWVRICEEIKKAVTLD